MTKNVTAVPKELEARIKNAVFYTRLLGVICVIVALVYGLDQAMEPSVRVFVSIVFAVMAAFYLSVGTKIKEEMVESKNLLLFCAILGLPLAWGILPLLAVIGLFSAYFSIRKYEKQGAKAFITDAEYQERHKKTTRTNKRLRYFLYTLLAIVGVLAIVAIIAAVVSSDPNSATKSDTQLSLESNGRFVSSEFGFTVTFPNSPQIEHSTLPISGVNVPIVQFVSESNGGEVAHMFQVAQYPTDTFQVVGQERSVLDGGINGMSNTSGYTRLSSSNSSYFGAYPSAYATFNAVQDGKTYPVYALLFVKGNDLYTFMTIGTSQQSFDDFTSSFSFN